ncbi:MAG: hypothetical protein MUC87_13745 [Bacteroidia bacterium]|jgi:hypothetical protein|nr:hypothetical protein [Bacteroidia bacterium]
MAPKQTDCFLFGKDWVDVKNSQNISLKEKKESSIYQIKNPDLIDLYIYKVDGGISKSKNEKCDYLILKCTTEKPDAYFIELKGNDLLKAVDQITATIDNYKNDLKEHRIYARIVVSRVISTHIYDSRYKKLNVKIKELRGDLKTQSQKMIETIRA